MPFFVCEDVLCRRELLDAQRAESHLFHGAQGVRFFEMAGHIREFVQAGEQAGVRAFAQQDAALKADQENGYVFDGALRLGGTVGKFRLPAFRVGTAESSERALVAERRRIRQTDRRAKIHKGLVEGAGRGVESDKIIAEMFGIGELDQRPEKRLGIFACLRCQDAVFVAGESGKDAQQVAVDGGDRFAECDGADRGRRVRADPRQFSKIGRAGGHLPAIVLHEDHGGLVQVADTAVVAEPLPQFQIGVFVRGSECGDIGERFQETRIVPLHGLNTGLLQHDLRNPDMVRRRVLAPREDPAVFFVPKQKAVDLLPDCIGRNETRRNTDGRTVGQSSGGKFLVEFVRYWVVLIIRIDCFHSSYILWEAAR